MDNKFEFHTSPFGPWRVNSGTPHSCKVNPNPRSPPIFFHTACVMNMCSRREIFILCSWASLWLPSPTLKMYLKKRAWKHLLFGHTRIRGKNKTYRQYSVKKYNDLGAPLAPLPMNCKYAGPSDFSVLLLRCSRRVSCNSGMYLRFLGIIVTSGFIIRANHLVCFRAYIFTIKWSMCIDVECHS
jgi:hypothetical protein